MTEGWAPVGWGAVATDLASIPATYSRAEAQAAAEAGKPPTGVPEDVIKAFLQAHHAQQQEDSQHLSAATSLESEGGLAAALQSSGATQPKQQHATAGPNPFSRQQHSQPSAPDIATRLPHTAVASSSRGRAGTASAKQQSSRAGRKPLLKRLLRALMITGASAGLLAAGAWAGTAAYRHYMAQLDDRDQLARRVAELKKQEEKLVLRCTAIEQDRSGLQGQVAQLAAAVGDGEAARSKLKLELKQAHSDREEAVRLNLKLQGKLAALEEAHGNLQSSHKEVQTALELSRAEASRLGKEAGQLAAVVEKLEGRCADLQTTKDTLLRESAALTEELQQQRKQQMAKAS